MITCIIRYQIDPWRREAFESYAQAWSETIPKAGARLIGYFSPHEGTTTTAYGAFEVESLAAYEAYRARLKADPHGAANFAFAQAERFIRREDRQFYRRIGGTP